MQQQKCYTDSSPARWAWPATRADDGISIAERICRDFVSVKMENELLLTVKKVSSNTSNSEIFSQDAAARQIGSNISS